MTLAGIAEGFGSWKPPQNIFEKVRCSYVTERMTNLAPSQA